MSRPPAAPVRRRRREARAAARERILAAGERLLAERPFRELTVEDLMAEADLARTAFYRHFDDLPRLVLALLEQVGEELAQAVRPLAWGAERSGEEATHEVLAGAVQAYVRHGRLLRAVDDAARHDEEIELAYRAFVERWIEATADGFERAMASGEIPSPFAAAPIAAALTHMNGAYLIETLGGDRDADPDAVLDTLWTIWRRTLWPERIPARGMPRDHR